MMDQYNIDQYNKETAQIHAPVDLIRRTKEAVREEEQRIARERQQQSRVAASPERPYGKVYRWALPVAAAVFCAIILNVVVMGSRVGSGKSHLDVAMDTASGAAPTSDNGMGVQFGEGSMSDEMQEAAIDTIAEDSSDAGAASAEAEESIAADETYESEISGGVQSADSTASAESDVYEDADYEEDENSYIKSIYGSDLWFEVVDEVPSFFADAGTECITVRGIEFYVARDWDDTWMAYAQVRGRKYVIYGELTEEDISREDFAEEAYMLLEDEI